MTNEIMYLCNRKYCDVCSNPNGEPDGCNHTRNIYYAKNFKMIFCMGRPPKFVEVELKGDEDGHGEDQQ